jgi:amino acid transporter
MATQRPSLRRALGMRDAVIIGLGSMIGAGVFTAIGPAAGAAGSLLLLGLLLVLPPSNAELVLAFATVLAVVNLQRRNGRLLPAAGVGVAA